MNLVEISMLIIMTIMSYFDIRWKRIPIWGLLLLAGFGLLNPLLEGKPLWEVAYSLLPGVGCLILAWVSHQIGVGDGMLILAVGLFYGTKDCFLILTIGLFLCFFLALVLLLFKKASRNTKLPFFPFLEGGLLLWRGVELLWKG